MSRSKPIYFIRPLFIGLFSLCSEYLQKIKNRDINDHAPTFVNFPQVVCQAPEDYILIDNVSIHVRG